MAKSTVESRLAILEADVARLKQQSESQDVTNNSWLTDTFGVYADFPEYERVVEFGRQYRASLKQGKKTVQAKRGQTKKPATPKE